MEKVVRLKGVVARVGFSKSMIYKMIQEGVFPKPYKYRGCSFWQESQIDLWILENLFGPGDKED